MPSANVDVDASLRPACTTSELFDVASMQPQRFRTQRGPRNLIACEPVDTRCLGALKVVRRECWIEIQEILTAKSEKWSEQQRISAGEGVVFNAETATICTFIQYASTSSRVYECRSSFQWTEVRVLQMSDPGPRLTRGRSLRV